MAPASDSEFLAAVKGLAQEFHQLPAQECRSAVSELLGRCRRLDSDIPPDGCKALLTFVLSVAALRCSGQLRPLQFHCLDLITCAGRAARKDEDVASRVDLHTFFFKLTKKEAKSQPMWKPRVLVPTLQYILRWIEVAQLSRLTEDGGLKPEIVTATMEALFTEMGRAGALWTPRWRLKASRALRRLFRAWPQALDHAITWAKKVDDVPALLVLAVGHEVAAAAPPCPQHGVLVELFAGKVLEAKLPVAKATLEAWSPVLAEVAPEELEKQLLPLAVRMSKRQPLALAQAFPIMVSLLKANLSRNIKEVMDPLAIEFLKDKDKRAQGRSIIQHAVKKCEDPAAPVAVAELWADGLKKASKTDEKQAALLAIGTLLAALPQGEATTAVEGLRRLGDAKGAIAKMAGEDANEDTRALGYAALGAVVLRLPRGDRDPVVQELLKPLADKKAPDRARVAALEPLVLLAKAACQAEAPSWAGTLLDRAVPLVTLAATKPVHRYQSMLAWAACGAAAASQSDRLGGRLKKEQLALLKDGNSFLNDMAAVLAAPTPEMNAQTQLWCALLCGHIDVSGLPSPGAATKALLEQGVAMRMPPGLLAEVLPIYRTAVVLLAGLHEGAPQQSVAVDRSDPPLVEKQPTPLERLGLLEAVAVLPEVDADGLVLLLTQALVAWLAEISAGGPAGRKVRRSSLRDVLEDLCKVVDANRCSPRPETLALLAVAAHHPLLASRKWPAARFWRRLCTKGPLAGPLKRAASAIWRPLRELIGAARKVPATDTTGFRRACIDAATVLDTPVADARTPLQQEARLLIDDCITSLHSVEVGKEKDWDIAVFFAPEGRLYVEEGTYVAEEREDKNIKKNKFLKDLYSDEDLVAERPSVSAGANKLLPPDRKGKDKPGAKAKAKAGAAPSSGSMTASDIEAAKIAEQSETRARIKAYVDEASFVLQVLALLTRSEVLEAVLDEAMPELVGHLLALLKSPLTTLAAQRCLRALVMRLVPEDVLPHRELLPEALAVAEKGWLQRTPSACGTPGEVPVVEVVLDSASENKAMPPGPLAMILPLILRVLFDSCLPLQKVCARALTVLEKQLHLGAEVPEGRISQVFDSLSVALLSLPSQRAVTQVTMLAAAKHLVSTESQLARLADMFFAEDEIVRSAVVAALAEIRHNEYIIDGRLDAHAARAVLRLGALDTACAEVAKETLEELGLEADEALLMELIEYASQKTNLSKEVQTLVAKAIAEVLTEMADATMSLSALDLLTQRFREDAASRLTVARCLERVFASSLEGEDVVIKAFRFLLRQGLGLTSSSSPEAAELRDVLLGAGIALIERHGEEHADVMLAAIEQFEDSGAGAAAGESARLGVAVFLGGLAKHLPADHEKVGEILPRLLQRLLDPSSTASVQDAIVKVMPPLMKQNKEQATQTLEQLMDTALAPKTEEMTRRGAAMGLGATVKGLSIQAVSQHGILTKITAATENKKDHGQRQGALMCLEGLTLSLGRLFDPYVVSSLPLLLQASSDPNRGVQSASQSAAKAMMSQLSGPGVKQVLKPLLEGVKDKQWRTKLASIELLAAMTSCLPKQLAACLPQVVPALCGVINDQHAKVKEAAREALDRVGGIITSPELKAIAPELISALTDGAQFEHITKEVLDKLLGTSFVHHIDAPSLSLVCPLVQRALKERSAEMKRKGAQIVGSMVLLIKDAKDIQPYLPLLLPQLKVTLLDPIPDVRATAAKAFGTLANGLPEEMLGDVLPWLFNMLGSSESSVERSGAAHGLSEVLMAMGTERIELLLPDILANASNREAAPEVKEGYLGLFVYLPVAMGNAFEPYINEVLLALLRAQSDDTSSVRATAYQAAKVLTKQFGASHTALLLPPLEEGVFDADWRIRLASVQLMGQLIEQILRAHRIPTQSAELMFCDVLPKEWRTHMLASLYIVRSDENLDVKQSCAQVWKAVVQNTPRTLKELLPALMTRLIASLASTNREKQRVAARCVGDLVGKLGERVMPELMPIFMNTLSTGDAHVREGVCIGLAELINATTKDLLAQYLDDLIPAIRQAIIDDVDTVRSSASLVVALLHGSVGPRATTDVVTWVLAQLQDVEVEEHGHLFLKGLEQLMAKQPGAVLPIALSRLTQEPEDGYTPFQIRGLASIAVVPDSHTVHRHLSDVLPVLIRVASEDSDLQEVAIEAAGRVMDRVEQGGLQFLMAELVGAVQDSHNARRRASGTRLFEHFFDHTNLDVVSILQQVLPAILPVALADQDEGALATGMRTLSSIVKKCKKEELAPYMSEVRNSILGLLIDPVTNKVDPSKMLPGLCDHNGLEPLYPIYQHGLMFGSAEARELAAKGLGELVDHTSEAALKPFVVKITGPLIRIVGDRFPGTVKKAIVDTLKSLLIRGGATLKPFLPQLQTMYVKCLADPTEAVRQKAAESLGTLVRLSARTEPLINELAGNVATHADPAVRQAMGAALGEVLLNVPQATSEASQVKCLDALLPKALGGDCDRREREAAAWALAMVLRRHVPDERTMELLKEHVEPGLKHSQPTTRHGAAFTLAGACWCHPPELPAPPAELASRLQALVWSTLPRLLSDGDPDVQAASVALMAGAARLHAEAQLPWGKFAEVEESFAALVAPGPGPPARLVLAAARHYAEAATAAGASVGARLAAAVAARGTDRSCETPEDAERAMAAVLGVDGSGEAQAKEALERLAGGLDKATSQALRDYASKRLARIAQYSVGGDFAWDF